MDGKRFFTIFLTAMIVFGLACGLLYALNLDLNTDTVAPGMVAKEIAQYHNLQFFFPGNNPYLFTDIYTFYLVPQILSGYSPVVLKLTAYLIFCLVVGVFSYLVYQYSGAVNALIFAALLTNLSPDAYLIFISPNNHVGTLLGTGLMLLLLSSEKVKQYPLSAVVVTCIAAGLILVSDRIFYVYFIVPFIAYYLYRSMTKNPVQQEVKSNKAAGRKETSDRPAALKMDVVFALLLIFSVLAYIATIYLAEGCNIDVPNFIYIPSSLVGLDTLISKNLPLYLQSLALILSGSLFNIASGQMGILDLIIAPVFLGILAYSALQVSKKTEYLVFMGATAAVIMFAAFLATDLAKALYSARYLIFTGVTVFMLVALAYQDKSARPKLNTLFMIALVIVLLATVPATIARVTSLDFQPNEEQYSLIKYLEDNNVRYSFADFGTANTVTYLSGGELEVRPISIMDNGILPVAWSSTKRWYYTRNTTFAIVTGKGDDIYNGTLGYAGKYPPDSVSQYGNYTIYRYVGKGPDQVRWFF